MWQSVVAKLNSMCVTVSFHVHVRMCQSRNTNSRVIFASLCLQPERRKAAGHSPLRTRYSDGSKARPYTTSLYSLLKLSRTAPAACHHDNTTPYVAHCVGGLKLWSVRHLEPLRPSHSRPPAAQCTRPSRAAQRAWAARRRRPHTGSWRVAAGNPCEPHRPPADWPSRMARTRARLRRQKRRTRRGALQAVGLNWGRGTISHEEKPGG